MFINDFPLSLYDEDTSIVPEDCDTLEKVCTPEKQIKKSDLKRFLALISKD